jgi:hypothetical protein
MGKLSKIVDREPVAVVVGAVIALIEAVLIALPFFGVDISADQVAALSGVLVAAGGLAIIVLSRRLVTPMAYPKTEDGEEGIIIKKVK